ncbi:MAG: GMC family oxidoreductase N-terminal domain-containing protein [Euryarchaeota archaeon]|nr:GMC family oxidoreductase N-terminal domain-containing protein [Euryarchaeota archaeon]
MNHLTTYQSLKKHKIKLLDKGPLYQQGSAAEYLKLKKVSSIDKSGLPTGKEINNLNLNEDNRFSLQLMYSEGLGGTTTISLANACYACSSCYTDSTTTQFQLQNLELYNEFLEASKEMKVNPLPFDFRGPTTQKMVEAAENLDFYMEAMPKFIDFDLCNKCGNCLYNCKPGAKWDARDYVAQAQKKGAELITDFQVKRILNCQGKVTGVEGIYKGEKKVLNSSQVVLSAGALNTPFILRNSGITEGVGEEFFCDLFITVGAYLKDAQLNQEIPMGVKSEFGPYFISPHYSAALPPLIQEKYKNLKKDIKVTPDDVVGIMIKIADESRGFMDKNGDIHKDITSRDRKLFQEGIKKATDLLIEMSADPESVVLSPVRGAHPGGTAPMGKVVNQDMQTSLEGLYVVDASIIPRAPGRPPILTIVALAKKLAQIMG